MLDKLELNSKTGVISVLCIILLAGMRLAIIGPSDDENLHAAIKREILYRLRANSPDFRQPVLTSNREPIEWSGELPDAAAIMVNRASLSTNTTHIGDREVVHVKVEFELPGHLEKTMYWRMRHRIPQGWDYYDESDRLSFLLAVF